MSEYWISTKKHYCETCNCWVSGNKINIKNHEKGTRHIENFKKLISASYKRKEKEKQENEFIEKELKKFEDVEKKLLLNLKKNENLEINKSYNIETGNIINNNINIGDNNINIGDNNINIGDNNINNGDNNNILSSNKNIINTNINNNSVNIINSNNVNKKKWTLMVNEDTGRLIFVNILTNEICYEKPKDFYESIPECEIFSEQNGWYKYFDYNARNFYYYNINSKKGIWQYSLHTLNILNDYTKNYYNTLVKNTNNYDSNNNNSNNIANNVKNYNTTFTTTVLPTEKNINKNVNKNVNINFNENVNENVNINMNYQNSQYYLDKINGMNNIMTYNPVMKNGIENFNNNFNYNFNNNLINNLVNNSVNNSVNSCNKKWETHEKLNEEISRVNKISEMSHIDSINRNDENAKAIKNKMINTNINTLLVDSDENTKKEMNLHIVKKNTTNSENNDKVNYQAVSKDISVLKHDNILNIEQKKKKKKNNINISFSYKNKNNIHLNTTDSRTEDKTEQELKINNTQNTQELTKNSSNYNITELNDSKLGVWETVEDKKTKTISDDKIEEIFYNIKSKEQIEKEELAQREANINYEYSECNEFYIKKKELENNEIYLNQEFKFIDKPIYKKAIDKNLNKKMGFAKRNVKSIQNKKKKL
ncbi:U1 small nuclear ribonucleoprotein C, putative [Hepatocystis sp. ex Piliocolobus tephrosceles]|nr:U1 small nuclear ribonucleoprotein C, putative [Hepatocystis sp. ex Piliocolobus tephrosceles]